MNAILLKMSDRLTLRKSVRVSSYWFYVTGLNPLFQQAVLVMAILIF